MSARLTFTYDESYEPAFPVITIEIDGYDPGRQRRTTTALVDSGADGTMLPANLLQTVNALYEDSVQMRGITGNVQLVDRYTVGVTIGEHHIPAMPVVALPVENEAIIGRDILNYLSVTLNGPAYTVEIEQ
jgi:predicted aspartyl protease